MNYEELETTVGVPAEILQRSAEARAKAEGTSTEAVVADWSGDEPPATAETAGSVTPTATSAAASGLPPVESLTGEALLVAAAEAKGIPLSLVERSARARADADGVPVEQVMRQWVVEAGLAYAGSAGPAAVAEVVVETAAAPAAAQPAPSPAQAVPSGAAPPAAPLSEPAPAQAVPIVEVLEPTAEVEPTPIEQPVGRYPASLAASLVIIPMLAVLYVLVVPNQPDCGNAGQVAVDPATGAHANCDGSTPYGVVEQTDLLLGAQTFAAACAVCHGDEGQGAVGPVMAGGAVLETFPEGACATHIEWVTVGSNGWPDDTYGAQGKPVAGGMPAASLTLTPEEIARVVLYERVAFGGEEEAAAQADCGLVAEDGEVTAAG